MSAEPTPADSPPPAPDGAGDPEEGARRTGNVLLAVFWIWAALLVVVTVAQIFELEGVLNVLDVKRWFAR